MKARAFILEDDVLSRQLVSMLTTMRGFDVTTLRSPEACAVFQAPRCACDSDHPCCDLMIVFHPFGGMSGVEFLEKQAERSCKAPARGKALIGHHFTEEEFDRAKKLGVRLFARPLNMQEFDDWLETCQVLTSPVKKPTRLPSRRELASE